MANFPTILDWFLLHRVRLLQVAILYSELARDELDRSEVELAAVITALATLVQSRGGYRAGDVGLQRQFLQLRDRMAEIRGAAYDRAFEALDTRLQAASRYERQFYSAAIQSAGRPVQTPITFPPRIDTVVMGQPLLDLKTRLLANDVLRLSNQAWIGARLGEAEADLRARLLGRASYRGADGAVEASRRELDAAVRTAVDAFTNAARVQVDLENPFEGKDIFTAILDSRTTDTCRSLHGQVFTSDSGPRPPLHYNCRSVRVPLVGEFTPDLPSFKAWMARLTAADQDLVLGPRQGQLFRSGQLTVENFREPAWRGMELSTMARQERRVFESAGMEVPFQ